MYLCIGVRSVSWTGEEGDGAASGSGGCTDVEAGQECQEILLKWSVPCKELSCQLQLCHVSPLDIR